MSDELFSKLLTPVVLGLLGLTALLWRRRYRRQTRLQDWPLAEGERIVAVFPFRRVYGADWPDIRGGSAHLTRHRLCFCVHDDQEQAWVQQVLSLSQLTDIQDTGETDEQIEQGRRVRLYTLRIQVTGSTKPLLMQTETLPKGILAAIRQRMGRPDDGQESPWMAWGNL